MVFVKDKFPSKQVGYNKLPQVYAKINPWREKTTPKLEKQIQRLQKEKMQKLHEHNIQQEYLRKKMEAHRIGHEMQTLQNMHGISPHLTAYKYR